MKSQGLIKFLKYYQQLKSKHPQKKLQILQTVILNKHEHEK